MLLFLRYQTNGRIALRSPSQSPLNSPNSYLSLSSSTVLPINFIAAPQASRLRKDSSSNRRQASITFSRAISPCQDIRSTSAASASSMMCLRLWLLRMGTAILAGSFSLCSSKYYRTRPKVSPSTSSSLTVPSLESSARAFPLREYLEKSSSLSLNYAPSEVTILRVTLEAFSGGGCVGGGATSTFFLAPIRRSELQQFLQKSLNLNKYRQICSLYLTRPPYQVSPFGRLIDWPTSHCPLSWASQLQNIRKGVIRVCWPG